MSFFCHSFKGCVLSPLLSVSLRTGSGRLMSSILSETCMKDQVWKLSANTVSPCYTILHYEMKSSFFFHALPKFCIRAKPTLGSGIDEKLCFPQYCYKYECLFFFSYLQRNHYILCIKNGKKWGYLLAFC